MKKVITSVLAMLLVMSLAVSISAVSIPGNAHPAPGSSPTATVRDLIPTITGSSCEDLEVFSLEDLDKMPEDVQELLAEAKGKLPEYVPEGTTVQFFFYVDVCEECGNSSMEFKQNDFWAPVVIQYTNSEWIELDYVINSDRTLTVFEISDGPVAFLIEHKPDTLASGCEDMLVFTLVDVEEMTEEAQETFEQAMETLVQVTPEDMLIRYLFHVEICEKCGKSTVQFQMEEFNDVIMKQFRGRTWVDLDYTRHEDGTVTVEDVTGGILAVIVK